MTTYLIYFKELFEVLFISFVLGSLLLKVIYFSGARIYTKIFLSFLSGVLILTIAQSVISTKLNTVLLIVPFLLALGYYTDKKQSLKMIGAGKGHPWQFKSSSKLSVLLEASILAILLYSIQFFLLFEDGDSGLIRMASQDLTFYARCADYISATGLEVCNNDYLFSASSAPYHFADLWFNSAISNIGRNNTALSLILTAKVVYMLMIYLGLMAIVENKYQVNYKIKSICALTLFFTPLYFSGYEDIRILSDMAIFSQTLYQAQKLFFIQILLLAAIVLNMINYRKLSVTALLCISILYTVTILPVFAGFALYLISAYIINNKIAYDELMIGTISASYVLVHYFVINPYSEDLNPYSLSLSELINFKHTINIIGATAIRHIVLFFPVIVLFIHYIKYTDLIKNNFTAIRMDPIYIFIMSMPVFGLMLWSITAGETNAVQLFQNIAMPIFYTGAIVIILASFIELNQRYKFIIFSLLFINAFFQIKDYMDVSPTHDRDFIEKIIQKEVMGNNIYVIYKPVSWYASVFSFGDKGINLGNYLAYVKNNTQPVSLDMVDVPIIGDANFVRTANKSLRSSTFYRYIEEKRKNGISKQHVDYQLDFIKENNVRILVTLQSVELPEHLDRLVVERIQDDVSGEVVCILANTS